MQTSSLSLQHALPDLVKSRFIAAKASNALIFSETVLSIIHTQSGTPFQLRFCPALAKKPKANDDEASKKEKQVDPFDKPSGDLLVAELPVEHASHVLVLNKYPVIPQHFILATKTNKQQTRMLESDDLTVTYACLKAWEQDSHGRKLFAFLNSGKHSGASQAHRHLQFLPVDEMDRQGQDGQWEPLINQMLKAPLLSAGSGLRSMPELPFTHFAVEFLSDPTHQQLQSTYHALYEKASEHVGAYIDSGKGDLELHPDDNDASPISYNLAMTTSGMAIVPRRREGTMLKDEAGKDVGFVALNGTVLAGTMMVKLDAEQELLKSDTKQLNSLLEAIGIPVESKQNRL